MGRLTGKVAFITGAGGGIGSAATRRFVEEGARVVVADVDEAAAINMHVDEGAVEIV